MSILTWIGLISTLTGLDFVNSNTHYGPSVGGLLIGVGTALLGIVVDKFYKVLESIGEKK